MNYRIIMQLAGNGGRIAYFTGIKTHDDAVRALNNSMAYLHGHKNYRYPILEYRSNRWLEMHALKVQAS